jgi:hypothetical protein
LLGLAAAGIAASQSPAAQWAMPSPT